MALVCVLVDSNLGIFHAPIVGLLEGDGGLLVLGDNLSVWVRAGDAPEPVGSGGEEGSHLLEGGELNKFYAGELNKIYVSSTTATGDRKI